MKVLAIGVHPDDVEFGMGATLSKHISLGHEVHVIVLTDGARDELGNYTKSNERRQESINALKILGYDNEIIFLNLPKVTRDQSTIRILEEKIDLYKPDRIYTHSRNDRHQDHRNCCYAVLSAGRYINEILLFEVYSVFPEFVPNYIINISKDLLDLKIKANCQFKSQFKMELITKMLEGLAIKNSFQNYALKTEEIRYSEGFEIAKIVKNNDQV
ncbi:MAG: PIG-L family deacetylase [Candidatus Lokiarchaeota archaeon]|nr:PIG-L family deacetylase [Candidatus Lokiarchaeota archaeon]